MSVPLTQGFLHCRPAGDRLEEATDNLVARIQAATEVTDDLVNTVTAFIEDMLANLSLRSR